MIIGAHLERFTFPLSESDPARASALLSPKVNPTVNRPVHVHVRRPHHRDVSLRIKRLRWWILEGQIDTTHIRQFVEHSGLRTPLGTLAWPADLYSTVTQLF